jgi:multisubunit Na+/H+ antiporter MnhB subunit
MAEETETQQRPSPATVQGQERRPPQLSERDLKWKQFRERNPRFRMFLIVGVVVLLVAGFFLWRYFNSYESTDDA